MAEDIKKLNADALDEAAGGDGLIGVNVADDWKQVAGLQTGWLALRSVPMYDYSNEIGKLYNGYRVKIVGSYTVGNDGRPYVEIYSRELNKTGWVNSNYIR